MAKVIEAPTTIELDAYEMRSIRRLVTILTHGAAASYEPQAQVTMAMGLLDLLSGMASRLDEGVAQWHVALPDAYRSKWWIGLSNGSALGNDSET